MYARRYPPLTEEITIPENYSGSQFTQRQWEGKEEKDSSSLSPSCSEAEVIPAFSEESLAPEKEEATAPEEEKTLSTDTLLLALALLLAENGIEEGLDFFLLLLLLF